MRGQYVKLKEEEIEEVFRRIYEEKHLTPEFFSSTWSDYNEYSMRAKEIFLKHLGKLREE